MPKAIMIFTSMTGNTEEMAEAIAEGVREQGIELDVKEVLDAVAVELEQYDGILLGAYTWGDGELPDDFLDFYDELDDVDLTGKKAAVFGSCDSSYEKYGAAVDILIEKLQERGAEVVLEGLKVELTPTKEEKQLCIAFGRNFAKQL
ncbi:MULTISPECIES: flavodoxin [Anoxybacillus]|uniref:Flavodoxin n=2 Tax=Anoxybacillus TaxID=150247 RepID=A0A178TDJ3_9BACL|nr:MULTISPECIES: flavodoxin [Anoxybacillus]ASA96000.1 flavodoxin [Anoxybacillus flavithermus]ELK21866.1 flavodoxin [Anoxybacillus flavithermus TNO-09.006]MBE2905975.1 flavodoxin [Anoxybacillus flavithermus]MBE2909071.1 flavodoxin [Anoxybacillus flavithermus]MBE2911714.1 flavodoxin [Anoxybacillus flavithermus]